MTPVRHPARLALLAAGLLATAGAAQPPAVPPPGTQTPPAAPPAAQPPKMEYPKQIAGKGVETWIKEDLKSPDPAVREAAVKIIPLFGPDARKPALAPLIAATTDRDPGVRVNAVLVLGGIGAETPEESKRIADALALVVVNASPGNVLRLHAIRALATYGPEAWSAVAAVRGATTDPSWETRRAVAYTLGRIGYPQDEKMRPSDVALKGLAGMLNDASAAVRVEVAQSLLLLGPPLAKDAEYARVVGPYLDPILARLKTEKDRSALVWLNMLVMRYDGSQLTEANIRKVGDFIAGPDATAKVSAITALGLLGEKARPAVPAVIDALGSNEPVVQAAAVSTLAALGDAAKAALPALQKLKADAKDDTLKALAGEAVEVISGRKKALTPPPEKK